MEQTVFWVSQWFFVLRGKKVLSFCLIRSSFSGSCTIRTGRVRYILYTFIYFLFYFFLSQFWAVGLNIRWSSEIFFYIFLLISSYGAVRQSCLNDVSRIRIYFFFTNRAVLVISKLVGFTSDDVCFILLVCYILGGYTSFFSKVRQLMVKYAFCFFLFFFVKQYQV